MIHALDLHARLSAAYLDASPKAQSALREAMSFVGPIAESHKNAADRLQFVLSNSHDSRSFLGLEQSLRASDRFNRYHSLLGLRVIPPRGLVLLIKEGAE